MRVTVSVMQSSRIHQLQQKLHITNVMTSGYIASKFSTTLLCTMLSRKHNKVSVTSVT